MHFVLSLFCDVRVVEIFILRLVHLESGIFHDFHVFFLFRLGLLNLVGMASYFFVTFVNEKSSLGVYM